MNKDIIYLDCVSDDIMENLEDCLLEVFDYFGIVSIDRYFSIIGWHRKGGDYICVYNVLNKDLLYRISDYISDRKDMITSRLGYDIVVGCNYDIGRIYIKPLVPYKITSFDRIGSLPDIYGSNDIKIAVK